MPSSPSHNAGLNISFSFSATCWTTRSLLTSHKLMYLHLHPSPSTTSVHKGRRRRPAAAAAAAARRSAILLRSGLKTSKMKSYAACPHDVLLVIAETGMVKLAIWGPWALMACCDVAKRGEPWWVATVLADPNPVTVADLEVL